MEDSLLFTHKIEGLDIDLEAPCVCKKSNVAPKASADFVFVPIVPNASATAKLHLLKIQNQSLHS
jgi:hypothetical protein